MANVLMQLMLDIRQLQSSLQQAQASMQTATSRMNRQVQRTGRQMQAASKKTTGFANAVDFLKKRVIGAGLFFAAFYQGLILFRQTVGEVISEFFDLDDALRRVQSITKESDESIERLRKDLLSLAKAGALFDQSASDVADSMFTIAQAGFSTSESLELAKLAAEGAAVGFTTAEVAAKVLVGVLKAYDMPVSKARDVMDILFQTVDTGIVTFEDLSTNLGRVLASASALNVPLTEITGTVATLTLRGFTAAQAMTSVNRILMTFLRPSQRARKAAEALGIELNRDTIAAEGLVPMLNKMWVASGQNANKFAEMFDRIQSTRGALSLMSDDGALLTRVMGDMGIATADAGAMASALEHRAKSLKFQMAILRSQILAVMTGALTPLTSSIAGVVQQFNQILSGKNAFFSFFADLRALTLAAAAAFLYMKRAAVASIFISITSALTGLVTILRVSVAEVGLFGTALRGLGGALATFGPLLIFLGAFALFKFAKQFDPLAKATKRAQERLAEFNEELSRHQFLLEEGIITPEQFGVLAWESAISALADVVQNEFAPSMHASLDGIEGFVGSLGRMGGQIRRVFTLDFRGASSVMRDDFNKVLEETILNLKEAGATSTEIKEVAKQLRILSRTSEDMFARELFAQAAADVQAIGDEAAESEDDLVAMAKAGEGLTETFGDTVLSAKDVKEGIEKWVKPIKDAKALIEDILGLTTQQDIVYRTMIEPVEDRIALRNIAIADAKAEQAAIALELGKSVGDMEEGENAIFDVLEDEVVEHERLNDADDTLIDKLETRLDYEKEIGETQVANNVLADLRNGKLDALTGTLMPEQKRLLAEVITAFGLGGDGLTDWIKLTEAMGETLDEDVLDAIFLIVDSLDDNDLAIEVDNAMAALGLVETKIGALRSQLEEGELSLEAYRFGAGILAGGAAGGFQHGVRNFVGGLARVGEAGSELVRLPRGSDVIPHGNVAHELRREGRQRGDTSAHAEVNITTSLLKDFQELKAAVVQAVVEKLDDAAARVGMAKPRYGTWGAGMPRT